MVDFVRRRAFILCLIGVALTGLSSCDDNDPNYDEDVLTEVELAPTQLTGKITGKDGSNIAGAIIKMGDSVTATDENGIYMFDDVQPGEYTLLVEAEGRLAVSGTINVKELDKSQILIWNAILAKELKEKVVVSKNESITVNLPMEVSKDVPQDLLTLEALVPVNAVASTEKAVLTFVPLCGNPLADSRVSSSDLYWGTEISCNIPNAKLEQPVLLKYQLDEQLISQVQAKKLVNGKWQSAETVREGNTLTVKADEITTYAVKPEIQVKTKDVLEPVQLSQSEWDNLYGKRAIRVKDVDYTYKVGSEIIAEGDSFETALTVALVKAMIASGEYTTETQTHKLGIRVRVGRLLLVTGMQHVKITEVRVGNELVIVKEYGDVEITTAMYDRDHSGGTN